MNSGCTRSQQRRERSGGRLACGAGRGAMISYESRAAQVVDDQIDATDPTVVHQDGELGTDRGIRRRVRGSRTAKCAVVLADVVAVAASMCIAVWARNRLLT